MMRYPESDSPFKAMRELARTRRVQTLEFNSPAVIPPLRLPRSHTYHATTEPKTIRYPKLKYLDHDGNMHELPPLCPVNPKLTIFPENLEKKYRKLCYHLHRLTASDQVKGQYMQFPDCFRLLDRTIRNVALQFHSVDEKAFYLLGLLQSMNAVHTFKRKFPACRYQSLCSLETITGYFDQLVQDCLFGQDFIDNAKLFYANLAMKTKSDIEYKAQLFERPILRFG